MQYITEIFFETMKIKLKGLNEFEAFTLTVRLLAKSIIVETLSDWCYLKSIEKLTLKLIQIAAKQGQFKKKIHIGLDELQTILLYEMLQEIPLASYEAGLANRIIEQIEQQYHNARALQMSLIDRTNESILKLIK